MSQFRSDQGEEFSGSQFVISNISIGAKVCCQFSPSFSEQIEEIQDPKESWKKHDR